MPQVGPPVRELSVGEVSQIQHRRNVIIISILALVFLGAFFFSLRDLSPTYTVGIVFLLGFFLISFINIRIGFLLVILAFLLSPEINLPMTQFRDFTLRAEDMLLIVLSLAWLGRLAMGLQKHFIIRTPLNLPIALIILWNIICSWRAISAGLVDPQFCVFTNLKIIEFFMVYFIIVNNLNDINEVKFMFYALLITALIVAIYAIFQIPKTQIFTVNRLTAPFEGKPEPNTLGAYLAIFFGMALSIFIYTQPGLLRKLCAALLFILPFPIMFSFSRSAYMATIGITVAVAIISKRKWLIFSLIAFLILSPFILPRPVIERALYNFRDARYFGFLDASAGERFFAFTKAWDYVKKYTILGGGIGAGGGILDNQYVRIIMETGLVGLILFLWLILRLLKLGIQLFKSINEGWIKGVAIGFLAAVIGLTVHCLGNITFYIVRIAEPFWALTALVAYMLYYINTQKDNSRLLNPNKI